MNVRGWWERMRKAQRKRLFVRRLRPGPRLLPRPVTETVLPSADDPIQARVDMVRFAAFAEAAAEICEAGPPADAREHFDEACLFFGRAIEAAGRAGLVEEVVRLKARRATLRRHFGPEPRSRRIEFRRPPPRQS